MAAILQTRELGMTYGRGDAAVHALHPTNLTVEEGELLAIMGPSGSGKSTLLHLLGGLGQPTHGKVYLKDHDIYRLSDRQLSVLRRRRFGFVFQFFNLVQELTAYENIVLPILVDGRKVDQSHVQSLVELLGIGDRLQHLPNALSGGQQQRVAIARALAVKPAVVFADEPTGNLDGKAGREVMELLHLTQRTFHQTLVMVTHDAQIADGASRLIRLEDGRVVADTGAVGGGEAG
jgi:putative ABC transport system ATP-binding protein